MIPLVRVATLRFHLFLRNCRYIQYLQALVASTERKWQNERMQNVNANETMVVLLIGVLTLVTTTTITVSV